MVEIHRIKIHFYKKGCKKFLQPSLKFYKVLISTWNFIIAKLGQILFHFMAWVCFRNFTNDKWRDEIWIQNQFGPKCCGVTLLHFMARVCFRNFADDEWWDEICTGSWKCSQRCSRTWISAIVGRGFDYATRGNRKVWTYNDQHYADALFFLI